MFVFIICNTINTIIMEMKLIKLENEYYLTTEAKVEKGDYGLAFAHGGRNGFGRGWYIFYHDGRPVNKLNAICAGSRKITHSTAPIDGDEVGGCFNIIKQLSPKNCQAIANGYDLGELALEAFELDLNCQGDCNNYYERLAYKLGMIKALEVNSDKRFTFKEMVDCWNKALNFQEHKETLGDYMQSLQQTEWDVEIEMGNTPIWEDSDVQGHVVCKKCGEWNESQIIPYNCKCVSKPKLDANGCLILKRK